MLHILLDTLLNSVLITGIVIIMMMMIESFNLERHNGFFEKAKGNSLKQVILAALLGSIPGCIGGFAAVSLYSRRLIGFGALTAMMIASCGDEAFVMLAMMPDKALWIFALLFVLAVFCGTAVDLVRKRYGIRHPSTDSFQESGKTEKFHDSPQETGCMEEKRSLTWQRALLTATILLFAVALMCGWLEHEHGIPESDGRLQINLLSEWWMNLVFAFLCVTMAIILCFRSDRFIRDTLCRHVLAGHLPVIFAWTFCILFLIGILSEYIDISRWVSDNPALMILLAVLIGIIPESGPHLVFVSLYAGGLVPFPVLLASCISQDGHSALPLLAEDKKSFAVAKLFKCIIALAAGYGTLLLF